MRFELPEISWHSTQPIYCCDFQRSCLDFSRLATGGADNDVKLWKVWSYEDKVKIEVVSILSEHKRSVNCVKFSPDGLLLGSCDDDGLVIIWVKCNENEAVANSFLDDANSELNKEFWRVHKLLRGHIEEVMDLCWSSDGSLLLSGSLDTTARLWNTQSGQCVHTFREGKGLVQGVTIDPLGKFLATYSDDKSVRIYHGANKRCAFNNKLFTYNGKQTRIFGDVGECFFHRVQFSVCGEFLFVPSGSFVNGEETSVFCSYLFCRDNLNKPCAYLPSGDRPSIAAAFNPNKYTFRNPEASKRFNLRYRLVFAVVTENSVVLYDTETCSAFARLTQIHYATLNSACWSPDGNTLITVSSDGYVTITSFEVGELGELFVDDRIAVAAEPPTPNISTISRPETPTVDSTSAVNTPTLQEKNTPTLLKPKAEKPHVKEDAKQEDDCEVMEVDANSPKEQKVSTKSSETPKLVKESPKVITPKLASATKPNSSKNMLGFFTKSSKKGAMYTEDDEDDDIALINFIPAKKSNVETIEATKKPMVSAPLSEKQQNGKPESPKSAAAAAQKRRANFVTLTKASTKDTASPVAVKRKVPFTTITK